MRNVPGVERRQGAGDNNRQEYRRRRECDVVAAQASPSHEPRRGGMVDLGCARVIRAPAARASLGFVSSLAVGTRFWANSSAPDEPSRRAVCGPLSAWPNAGSRVRQDAAPSSHHTGQCVSGGARASHPS